MKNRFIIIKQTLFKHRIFLLKAFILYFIASIYLNRAGYEFEKEPYIEGDGFEYAVMTESFYNHFSPDLQTQDLVSFKYNIYKSYKTNEFPKGEYIDGLCWNLNQATHAFKQDINGFFYSKQKKFYCYHYYTYSLFCVPARIIGEWTGSPILHTFYKTNALLVIITCLILLFSFSKNLYISIFSALCFCFGSCYWYLGWEHTEIFSTSLVVWGLVFFLNKKRLLGLFFIALATSQTQTLMLFLALLAFWAVFDKKFNIKYMFYTFLVCFVAFTPIIFYYYHFDTTNLIKDMGFLDNKYITGTRLFGFYFDLNQGMVLAMPLILITYIVLYVRSLISNIKTLKFHLLFPVICICMTLVASSMGNWNPGQSIVHRYTTWIGAIIFVHTFYLLDEYNNSDKKLFLLSSFLWTQIIACFYFQTFNKFDWEQENHKDIATWVLDNYPEFYNPDPIIFSVRTDRVYAFGNVTEPIFYFDKERRIKKVMFNKDHLDKLKKYCGKNCDVSKFSTYKDDYGWAYMHTKDIKTLKGDYDIYLMVRSEKVARVRNKLLNTHSWFEAIKKKAVSWNMTVDAVLDLDAEYLVKEEEKLKFK